jgi:hypothetical protein
LNLSGRLDVPPERWQQIEELYHAALEREPESRAAFLDEACAGDEEMRREVASLLGYDDKPASFIEAPVLEVAARELAPLSPLYPLAHLGLARAAALTGDAARSRKAYEDFFAAWKEAEADLPALLAARKEYR